MCFLGVLHLTHTVIRGRRDHVVVEFTTIYAISVINFLTLYSIVLNYKIPTIIT